MQQGRTEKALRRQQNEVIDESETIKTGKELDAKIKHTLGSAADKLAATKMLDIVRCFACNKKGGVRSGGQVESTDYAN